MIDLHVVASLKTAARIFTRECVNNPQKCGLTKSEKLWMEELSKVYLTAELDIKIPEVPTPEFSDAIKKATVFGEGSAITTRMILVAANIASEKDFFTDTSTFMTTLERHQEHWSQKFIEATHAYTTKRPIEDFMHAYFDDPRSISEAELTYYLTLYFKHFYRFLYEFMLFYTKSQSPIFYGRANP